MRKPFLRKAPIQLQNQEGVKTENLQQPQTEQGENQPTTTQEGQNINTENVQQKEATEQHHNHSANVEGSVDEKANKKVIISLNYLLIYIFYYLFIIFFEKIFNYFKLFK